MRCGPVTRPTGSDCCTTFACTFAGQMEIETLIRFVVRQCRDVLDAGGASVVFFDRNTNELYFPYVTEDDPEVAARLLVTRFPANRGIAGAVVQSAKPIQHAGVP